MRILDVDLPLTQEGPEIVAYLSEAYVWSGDVMDAVEVLVLDPREGSNARALALAEDSGSYIADFLAPLFDKVCSARGLGAGPTGRALQAVAERLHVAIVSLNWALMAS